jgi:hypothetical protein
VVADQSCDRVRKLISILRGASAKLPREVDLCGQTR